jgi:hypothetical protein
MKVTVDGKEHDVVHSFGDARAIINFDGAYVFVDRAFDGVWELSGEPARDGEEKQVLNKLLAPHLGVVDVKVTRDD